MLTIALTGGIGSGKTAVSHSFQKIANQSKEPDCLQIIDADIIARKLLSGSLKEASTALQEVYNLFGANIFDAKGELKRSQLRSLIFSSELKKQQLNDLLHPLIYQTITTKITNLTQEKKNQFAIIAIPLLFETKFNYKFDRILVVDVPVETQILRATQRDNCSVKLIKNIINSQVERQVRLNHADDIINNSGSLVELNEQIASLFQYYCSLSHILNK